MKIFAIFMGTWIYSTGLFQCCPEAHHAELIFEIMVWILTVFSRVEVLGGLRLLMTRQRSLGMAESEGDAE